MAATVSAMALLDGKSLGIDATRSSTSNKFIPTKPLTIKPISLLPFKKLPKDLATKTTDHSKTPSTYLTSSAIAATIFSTLSSCDPAIAAQQIADIAEGDKRAIALLLPIIPAILWVLYNILQPALNQLNRMRNSKGIIIGVGLGGLATASNFLAVPPSASAREIAIIADASSNDSRGLFLLFVVAPAIAWVLYNILQPALNQINRMRT